MPRQIKSARKNALQRPVPPREINLKGTIISI